MPKRIKLTALALALCSVITLLASPPLSSGARAVELTDNPDKTIRVTDAVDRAYIDDTLKGSVNSQDPLYQYQWYLQATHTQAAWQNGITGKGVRVAVIDSGVNAAHADFEGTSIASGHNYIDNSSDTGDIYGHGTFISGIIAAQTGNGIGINGMADGVTLVPLKVFDGESGSAANIIKAIYDAVDVYHCEVINMSFGFGDDDASLHDALKYAYGKGVILVAAAGNDGTAVPDYPAAYPEVIGVGSVTNDAEASQGVTESSFSQRSGVFVTAPGSDIVSLSSSGNGYAEGDGTSFSAPQVTAMAAMAKQVSHNITTDEFKALLQYSSTDLGASGKDALYGYGLINVKRFIDLLQSLTRQPQTAAASGDWTNVYTDVSYSDWFYHSVAFVSQSNLFQGTSAGIFNPSGDMTRGMVVTLVARLYERSGYQIAPSVDGSPFADAEPGSWYYASMEWAALNGIVEGYQDDRFGPGDSVTREQLAVFLYRYAQYAGLPLGSANGQTFYLLNGWDSTAGWAEDAMIWAVANGLIQGKSDWTLDPGGVATRAEVAQLMARFCGLYDLS